MNKSIRKLTETGLLLALLVVLQAATKAYGQIVTGSCVNAVLAVAALLTGLGGSLAIALISPVLAYLLGIAPQAVVVPAIMAGNAVYVTLLVLIAGRQWEQVGARVTGWLLAALAKFAALYLLVGKILCGLAAAPLLAAGVLKEPMLKTLPAMFAWPQLITALIGGGVALALTPVLKNALRR